ncbi:hypothetical protein B0H10DRAFT_2274991 [Mycena sp. CBHHK59/15]|nr:hypothetical protein B0H10DRAFT_2274991 [Mycena sp. CBHHK59/15]
MGNGSSPKSLIGSKMLTKKCKYTVGLMVRTVAPLCDGKSISGATASKLQIRSNMHLFFNKHGVKPPVILQSFELCAVGPFNCSQASLTSPAALATLHDLPKTNPTLHLELTGLTTPPEEIENEDLFSKDEEDLTYNDESDVPVQVVITHIVSHSAADLPDGFKLDSDKNLVRIGAVEDVDLDVIVDDLPLALSRSKRTIKKPSQFRDIMWEEH